MYKAEIHVDDLTLQEVLSFEGDKAKVKYHTLKAGSSHTLETAASPYPGQTNKWLMLKDTAIGAGEGFWINANARRFATVTPIATPAPVVVEKKTV